MNVGFTFTNKIRVVIMTRITRCARIKPVNAPMNGLMHTRSFCIPPSTILLISRTVQVSLLFSNTYTNVIDTLFIVL